MKSPAYKTWLTLWYVGFFGIVVIILTTVIFIRLERQIWDAFDYSISQLGEEMLDEIFELRDDLDLSDADILRMTGEQKIDFSREVNRELKEESFDNQLPELGFVELRDHLTGQLLFQSPEIQDNKIGFVQPGDAFWGYRPFTFRPSGQTELHGIGYSGRRDFVHYFAAFIFNANSDRQDPEKVLRVKLLIYELIRAIDRESDSYYMQHTEELKKSADDLNGLAYVYFFDTGQIFWATVPVDKEDVYLPTYETGVSAATITSKEFFTDIQDSAGHNYRQLSIVYDRVPYFLYRADLAISSHTVRDNVHLLAVYLFFAGLVLICIVWAGGRLLMRRALRPVDQVIQKVNEITGKNMDMRLPLPKMDIEIIQLVETFNDLLERLAESFQMQKTFIADASHELRTPLSILMAEIEMIVKKSEDPSGIKTAAANAAAEIERMARIVDDLHLLAVSDSGHADLQKKQTRLDELLISAAGRCQVVARKKNIRLIIDALEVVECISDEDLMLRAVINIIQNAIKYSETDKQVILRLERHKKFALISIADQGPGISNDHQKKIFNRFYRVDISRSRETGGTGLGLAISKWIVEEHDGSITVESEIGKGSTFRISIPIK